MQELSLLSKKFAGLVSQKLGESQFSQDVKAPKTEQRFCIMIYLLFRLNNDTQKDE